MKDDVVSLKGVPFKTLVAETPTEQQIGLQGRAWPPPVMTFPLRSFAYTKFWMNNTPAPLDIIFCRAGRVIGIFKGEPMSTKLVGPDEVSDLVVELPHGTAARIGLSVGDYVGFNPTK